MILIVFPEEKRMFSMMKRSVVDANSNNGGETQSNNHFVFGRPLKGPFPGRSKRLMLGMGCFWGVEKIFWNMEGLEMTAVGYSGGTMPNPTYKDVCSSQTGHNEVVLLHYNPDVISTGSLLKSFWEGHNPTQGMRQGNDIGSQYRSGIYTYDEADHALAIKTRAIYAELLESSGFEAITTEILKANDFYYAEDYHQQYLAKNPNGYCGLGGTGVCLQ
jgi:peptide-methionine (S)-S-oxide reductase